MGLAIRPAKPRLRRLGEAGLPTGPVLQLAARPAKPRPRRLGEAGLPTEPAIICEVLTHAEIFLSFLAGHDLFGLVLNKYWNYYGF